MTERIPIGNYPKWLGRILVWFLKHWLPKGTTLLLRGRGKRRDRHGNPLGSRYSLPLDQASRVGIYVIRPLDPAIIGYQYKPLTPVREVPPPTPTWDQCNNLESNGD